MKNKKGMIYGVLLMTCLVIGLSYGAFIFSTDKYRSSELLISKLNYSIDITEDGSSKSTINGSSVTVPASTKVYLNITLTSVNEIDSKYTLAYKTSTNAKVEYSDRTPWNTQGVIKGIDINTYSKKIRVVIDNTDISTSSTVNFQVYGGYSFNSYANIELTDGYITVSGPYTEVTTNIGNRLVDIIESDTSCLTSNSNTCLYGGENIKNYVQYPENEDKTKNLWRIIGSYQIDDQTLPKLISQSTTSTSTSTLTTDLTSFYNTLEDKDVLVQETNKFNCFTSTCAESTYNNIGLLTDYEYNQIGGVNSYLTSNENYYINTSTGIKEVTSSGITNTSSTSGLKPTIYLQTGVQVTGSGTVSDPYIISPASDINLVAYTLNGQATDKTYAELLKTNVVKNVTCKNGTTATWDNTDFSIKLKNIHTPDYCTIDFGNGYSVSLTATNGTVSAPTTVTTGYNGIATFTVTPNSGYKLGLETNTCGGTLSGNTYTVSKVTSNKSCSIGFKKIAVPLYNQLLADNQTIKTRTDFNTTFTETNTGTLYKATESIAGKTSKDVYYFAGDAQNNWVKFAGFYWRIIRTNHDGSIRLLYSGTSPDTTSGYIGESAFNSSNNNSMYAGYMYGTSGSLDNNRTNKNNSTIKTYIDNWYSNNLSSYTKYISTEAVYCNDREVVGGSYVAEELNKNSNSMIAFVDINDTNNLIAIAAPDKHYNFRFSANIRLQDNKQPTYNCTNNKDAFSGSNTEAKLTYPIGLMTADEVVYAGADTIYAMDNFPSTASVWYFLNKNGTSITGNIDWWTITPSISTRPLGALSGNSIYLAYVDNASLYVPDVFQGPDSIYASLAVRPAISIKSCALWSSGNGSASSPYEISTTSGC